MSTTFALPLAETVQCANCNKSIAESAAFCTKCGTKVEKADPMCTNGHILAMGHQFCGQCGAGAVNGATVANNHMPVPTNAGVAALNSATLPHANTPAQVANMSAPAASLPAPVAETPMRPAVLQPEVASPISNVNANDCPECLNSDQVRKLAVVMDEGTSSTTGTATTLGVGIAGGGVGLGLGGTAINSQTTSNLVSQFAPPLRPTLVGKRVLVGLGFGVFWALMFLSVSGTRGFGVFSLLVTGGALAYIIAVLNPQRRRMQAAWDQNFDKLRSGYFCFRDGVAFDQARVPFSPAQWTGYCFGQ